MYPSWEMFFNEKLTFKEKPTMGIKEVQEEVDWIDYMDVEGIETAKHGGGRACHHY